jgi:hypothetical protein
MAVFVNIERVVGRIDPTAIAMAVEGQEGVLRLQQQLMATLEDRLHEQLEACTQLSRHLSASDWRNDSPSV